jgi:hypothetical protein
VKIKPTPESAEVLTIRCQYDREVYALRQEISELRAQLAGDGSTWVLYIVLYIAVVLSFAAGIAAGCIICAVTP